MGGRGGASDGALWSACARVSFPLLFAASALALAFAIPALRSRILETASRGLGDREEIMALGVRLFLEHPLFGISPGTFGEHYAAAVGAGWTWRGRSLAPIGMPWTHSLPVEVAAEFGLLGVAAFGLALRHAWTGTRALIRGPDPLCRIGRGLAGALVAGLIVGFVDLSFIKDWFRIWFWLVLGVASLGTTAPAVRD